MACAFSYQVHGAISVDVKLLDNEVFRLKKESSKLADHRVRDLLEVYLIAKELPFHNLLIEQHVQEGTVVFDYCTQDLDGHLILETRRDHIYEALELTLL